MDKLLISEIRELSLIDVIGHPSIVIWLPYCNFRCPWCQNTPIVNGTIVKEISIDYLRELFSSSRSLVECVHVTGGEPTLHKETLRAIYEIAKENNLMTSLDTNGSNPDVVDELVRESLLDHLALDIKAPLDDIVLYSKVTGLPLHSINDVVKRIMKSIEIVFKNKLEVELRTTLIPDLNVNDIDAIASYVSRMINKYDNYEKCMYVLQQFIPSETVRDPYYKRQKPTSADDMIKLAQLIKKKYNLRVYVRSLDKGIIRL